MYESGENYLETILMLKKRNGAVRSIDIARELGFSKPSVSRAMSILRTDGYIQVVDSGYIELTDTGLKMAESVLERHTLLTEFLITVAGVDKEVAEKDACRMEHIICQETFDGLKKFMKNK